MLETLIGSALIGVLMIVVVPVTVYLSVKLGTFAYLKAKQRFNQKKERDNAAGQS